MPDPILITGCTGFIGGHLARRLLAGGVPVRGLARRPAGASSLAALGAEIVPGDLVDRESLVRAVDGCRVIVHAAAWTGDPALDSRQAWHTNVTATGYLLDAARQLGTERFVYFSSVAVYGLNRSPVIDERAATPPIGQLYPDSKIAAEDLVRQAQARGLATTILRPASTYGPWGSAWTVGPIEQLRAGRLVLLGRDEGLVNTGYVDNVVDGVLLALDNEAAVGETFNLCDGEVLTYRQFYEHYARMMGRDSLPTWPAWIARWAATGPGNLVRRVLGRRTVGPWSLHFRFNPSRFSIEKARRVLGYDPSIGIDEGMRHTEAWLREAGYLAES